MAFTARLLGDCPVTLSPASGQITCILHASDSTRGFGRIGLTLIFFRYGSGWPEFFKKNPK